MSDTPIRRPRVPVFARIRVLAAVALGLAVAGSAVACKQPRAETRSETREELPAAPVDAMDLLERAPDLNRRRFGQLAPAQRATLVVVFASWCPNCRRELGVIHALIDEFPALRVIGVNAFEDQHGPRGYDVLRAFIADEAPWLRVVRADDQMLDALGGVSAIPAVFVYDHDAQLVASWSDPHSQPPEVDDLRKTIAVAIARR